ncbi:hypothetical protein FOJ82_10750 [Tessaracoccus rhinocerotis]|uniref:DUF5302 domain-containing protein n=1 Tax=Tessaracoccus rhinocerotis TaxID=1689449 RepID=A0A553JZ98_9ACTN|nr:DUF5302 domain-containing protein [Tessaracoccus rhinocerotis]TRY17747.1 hypothetical protein FOJ82_10750 [Tessaracoccus rhinocerotis]
MSDSNDTAEPLDPKEAMRQALERKKASEQEGQARVDAERDKGGHAHGQVGGKRVFRRKSGG